jgi:CDP-diacylglycerol--glycerol-3-phosphate 3-phosphatidyltransferase
LATPANAITAARLLASPVMIVLVLMYGPDWVAVVIGALVFSTDGLDGWIARRQGTTSSGAFLDPLADKIVVLGVLYAFVYRGTISWIPVSLILLREVSMSTYRTIVARKGVSIPARPLAKIKTVTQDVATGLILLPVMKEHHLALVVMLWIAVALTIISGIQYLYDGVMSSSSAS